MAESKKILVAFDPENVDKASSDLLVPVQSESGEIEFVGTRSGNSVRYGMVVLTSRAVSESDLFARLVDTGRTIPDVARTLEVLAKFVDAMKSVKIGNVVEVDGRSDDTVALIVASNTPSGFQKRARSD